MNCHAPEVEYVSVPRLLIERVVEGYVALIETDDRLHDATELYSYIETYDYDEIDWDDCYPERNE
jgi:hypothetical protein